MGPLSVHRFHCTLWDDTFAQWLDLWSPHFSTHGGNHCVQNPHRIGVMCHCANSLHSHPSAVESEGSGVHAEEKDLGSWEGGWVYNETEGGFGACENAYSRDSKVVG